MKSVFRLGFFPSPMCGKGEHKRCPYDIPSDPHLIGFTEIGNNGIMMPLYGYAHGYRCSCNCHPENQPEAIIKKCRDCIDEVKFDQGTFLK